MAQLFTQPNSTLSGKLGDLVYYRRNGKTFIRTLPVKIKQSNSEKQIISQKRFSTLGKLFQIFRHTLHYQLPRGINSNNSFFYSLNHSFVNPSLDSVNIEYEKLILTNLGMKGLFGLKISKNENKVLFEWEEDNLQDNAYYVQCVVYCKDIQQISMAMVKRNALSATINLPIKGGDIVTYTIPYRL